MSRIDSIKTEEPVVVDPNHKRRAYIAFVVDESGSMGAGREATIRGMNEQIQMIKNMFKDSQNVAPIVTAVKFNETVTPLFVNKTLNELIEFTEDTYRPNGGTAMYDAVGYVLNQLDSAEGINDDDTTVLVVIVSDGEENSSKEHTSEMIAGRVKSFNETKRWTFTYLGANQDLSVVSQRTSFHVGNTKSFNSSNNATYTMAYNSHNMALCSYLQDVSAPVLRRAARTDFYSGAPESNETEEESSDTKATSKP
jgi:Mg-chelatase subunit ChlD